MLWEYVITRINKLFLAKEDDPDWIGCELSEVARGLTLILTTRPQTQSLTDQILHWPPNEDRLNPLLSGWAELSLCWNLNSIQPSHLPQLTPSWFLWQFLLDLSTQQRSTTTIGPNRSRSIQSNSMVAFHLAFPNEAWLSSRKYCYKKHLSTYLGWLKVDFYGNPALTILSNMVNFPSSFLVLVGDDRVYGRCGC